MISAYTVPERGHEEMRCYVGEDLHFQFYKLRYILMVTYLSYGDSEDEDR